jgi:hypothetical protein
MAVAVAVAVAAAVAVGLAVAVAVAVAVALAGQSVCGPVRLVLAKNSKIMIWINKL